MRWSNRSLHYNFKLLLNKLNKTLILTVIYTSLMFKLVITHYSMANSKRDPKCLY